MLDIYISEAFYFLACYNRKQKYETEKLHI